uniref:ELM2 domain-containing protein n=1 Tax=Strigamia maritima TaxID=126957 RepID=T1IZ60_STRMM
MLEKGRRNRIRIGIAYQTRIPRLLSTPHTDPDEKSTLLWQPISEKNEQKLNTFLEIAVTKHKYSVEQALAFLISNENDFNAATNDLKLWAPIRGDKFTTDEVKKMVDYSLHEDVMDFVKLKEHVFPDKSMGSILQCYYNTWKMNS